MVKADLIRVFLADSHVVVRDGLRLILEEQENLYVVGEASDGRRAVECIRELVPHLAVMGIGMPGLSGIEAIREIRKVSPETRIIYIAS